MNHKELAMRENWALETAIGVMIEGGLMNHEFEPINGHSQKTITDIFTATFGRLKRESVNKKVFIPKDSTAFEGLLRFRKKVLNNEEKETDA